MQKKSKNITVKGVCVIRYNAKFDKYDVDAGLKLGGPKKHRKRCATKQEALAHADLLKVQIKNYGLSGFKLSAEEQADAEKALKIAKPLDVSLSEAMKFYAQYHEQPGAKMTFADLVTNFRHQLEDDRAKGEGVKDRTFQDYKHRHKRLADELGDVSLITFSHEKHWLPLSRKLGTSSRRFENHLRILFNHAVEKEYIQVSPMKGKLSKATKLKKPAILREDQWRQLLLTAIQTDKELDLLCYVVLTLYMGLRPQSEVPNLSWKSINFKTKKLFIADDQTGKSDLGRTLEIPNCAIELLKFCKRKNGMIIESSYQHKKNWLNLREQAGFIQRDAKGKTIKNTWAHDVARHTAGTMVYAKTQSKELVRAFLGHTNDITMRHYVNHGESIDEEAERFFSFQAPSSSSEKNLKTA